MVARRRGEGYVCEGRWPEGVGALVGNEGRGACLGVATGDDYKGRLLQHTHN